MKFTIDHLHIERLENFILNFPKAEIKYKQYTKSEVWHVGANKDNLPFEDLFKNFLSNYVKLSGNKFISGKLLEDPKKHGGQNYINYYANYEFTYESISVEIELITIEDFIELQDWMTSNIMFCDAIYIDMNNKIVAYYQE